MARFFQQIRNVSSQVIQNFSNEIYKNLVIGKQGAITTIGINRPDKRNSLDTPTIRELANALDKFESDPTTTIVVIHGEGNNFCSGLDIDEIAERGYEAVYNEAGLLRRFPLTWKPSVCGIGGYAVAEGLELAFMADFRVVEDTAVLGAIGRRFGAPLAFCDGYTNNISAAAKRMLLSGLMISGEKANEIGIVDRSVSMGTALGQSISQAGMIAKYPQKSLIYDKMTMLAHQLPPGSERRLDLENKLKVLWPDVVKEADLHMKKFHEGIGRHGSYKEIGIKRAMSWEIEEDEIARK